MTQIREKFLYLDSLLYSTSNEWKMSVKSAFWPYILDLSNSGSCDNLYEKLFLYTKYIKSAGSTPFWKQKWKSLMIKLKRVDLQKTVNVPLWIGLFTILIHRTIEFSDFLFSVNLCLALEHTWVLSCKIDRCRSCGTYVTVPKGEEITVFEFV